MSLILSCVHQLQRSGLIWGCYLFLDSLVISAMQFNTRIDIMWKFAIFGKRHASNVELGSFNGSLFSHYNGTPIMAILQTLMKWDDFFIHHNHIWLTGEGLKWHLNLEYLQCDIEAKEKTCPEKIWLIYHLASWNPDVTSNSHLKCA